MSISKYLLVASDLHGLLRGKRLPVNDTEGKSLKMPLSILFPDVWGRDLASSDHLLDSGDLDGDFRLIEREPVPLAPWQPDTALRLGWMFHASGEPYPVDPRQALAAILGRFQAQSLTPVCAVELEFYLFDPARQPLCPPRRPGSSRTMQDNDVYALDDLEAFGPFLDSLYAACESADVPVEAAIAEYGRGQFEVNLKHQPDALKAADDAQLFKYLVKRVANQFGLGATFMAKPHGDDLGSGMHVHWSLLDAAGVNVFAGADEAGSDTLRAAVAGLLGALPESMLLLAPHFNSYRRFSADSLAPLRVTWGYENRTTALRIPAGPDPARRIEHRVAGADANPYLVLAVLLGSGLLGIEQRLEPPAPASGNQYLGEAPLLPATWPAAMDTFASGDTIATCFDPLFVHLLLAAKQQELARFNEHVSPFEYETYLQRF
ncbi:MAG: glutamine synthetase family protein [Pseudomonadota bacterium]